MLKWNLFKIKLLNNIIQKDSSLTVNIYLTLATKQFIQHPHDTII